MKFQITPQQILFFWCAVWLVVFCWPQAAGHLGKLLQRHSFALTGFYAFVGRGVRCYINRFRSWEYSEITTEFGIPSETSAAEDLSIVDAIRTGRFTVREKITGR
jgi:hypothetical protein